MAVRRAVGLAALLWLTDIGGLNRDEAAEQMVWSAQAMLSRALGGELPPG